MFKIVDKETWKRKDYFDYYFNKLRCTYSVTVNIDITGLMAFKRKYNARLYPLLIYVLSKAVNNHEEFRTAQNARGEIGVWDELVPCYTVFHEETKTFSFILFGEIRGVREGTILSAFLVGFFVGKQGKTKLNQE